MDRRAAGTAGDGGTIEYPHVATVLLGLKQFAETGTGANHPQVTIGNWA